MSRPGVDCPPGMANVVNVLLYCKLVLESGAMITVEALLVLLCCPGRSCLRAQMGILLPEDFSFTVKLAYPGSGQVGNAGESVSTEAALHQRARSQWGRPSLLWLPLG